MKEALYKNTSLTALAVAAGMVLSIGSAAAADLGGNCCADLEERVAELEATTARKGTRKTSLEIWGQVNKVIVAWDDGRNSNTVLGSDNVNASTRFGLRGNAKVGSYFSTGYSIVIEVASGGRTTNISQFQDKGGVIGLVPPNSAPFSPGFGVNDQAITARESNFWIESSTLGRMTLGRFIGGSYDGPTGQLDLGGIGSTVAGGSSSLIGTGLVYRTGNAPVNPANNLSPPAGVQSRAGNYSLYNIGNTTDVAGEYGTRENGIAWTSPTLHGFTLSAAIAGAVEPDAQCANLACTANFGYGPIYGGQLKYANESQGFRVAASGGFEIADQANSTSLTSTNGTSARPKSENWGLAGALLHVPTGLFAQAFYNEYTRGHDTTVGAAPSIYTLIGRTKDTAEQWQIQFGITKNWTGLGNTALYGEYGQTRNGFNTFGLERTDGATLVAGGGNFINPYFGDVTKQTLWGLGMVQNIDAAATELYAGYRNFGLTSDNCAANGGCKDIGMFTTGARIRF